MSINSKTYLRPSGIQYSFFAIISVYNTFSGFQDFLKTFSKLSQDFLKTFSTLSQHFIHTFPTVYLQFCNTFSELSLHSQDLLKPLHHFQISISIASQSCNFMLVVKGPEMSPIRKLKIL